MQKSKNLLSMKKQTEAERNIFDIQSVIEDCAERRTREEIARQTNSILELSRQNITNFNIIEDDTIKVRSAKRVLRKYENPDSKWYCHYTDNTQDLQLSKQDLTLPDIAILSLHGGALDYTELSKLEQQFGEKTCRWINFAYPGYDGGDDKRGNYSGGTKDMCELIRQLLDELGISEIIFVCHSFAGYIRNYFTFIYPQRVLATISIATHSYNHNIGMRSWTECFYRTNGYFTKSNQEILRDINTEEKRNSIVQNVRQSFQYMRQHMPQLQMELTDANKIIAMFQFMASEQIPIHYLESFKYLNPNIPNFITFGYDDPLITLDRQTETIYYHKNHNLRLPFQLRKTPEILNILQGIKFDFDKEVFFDNFLFVFDKCGHVPHLKRANELGQPLRIFATLIDHLNSTNQLKHLTQTFPKL